MNNKTVTEHRQCFEKLSFIIKVTEDYYIKSHSMLQQLGFHSKLLSTQSAEIYFNELILMGTNLY